MPSSGIKKITPAMRIPRLTILIKNDRFVLPIPLVMLMSVLFVYKKGHIQERVTI